ncbi:hypothetical protein D3C72_1479680 [compost metagenome]
MLPAHHLALRSVDEDLALPATESADEVELVVQFIDLDMVNRRREDVTHRAARIGLGDEVGAGLGAVAGVVVEILALHMGDHFFAREGALLRRVRLEEVGAQHPVNTVLRYVKGGRRRADLRPAQVEARVLTVAGDEKVDHPVVVGAVGAVAGVDDDDAVLRELPIGVDEGSGDAVARVLEHDLLALAVHGGEAVVGREVGQPEGGEIGLEIGLCLQGGVDQRGRLDGVHLR